MQSHHEQAKSIVHLLKVGAAVLRAYVYEGLCDTLTEVEKYCKIMYFNLCLNYLSCCFT